MTDPVYDENDDYVLLNQQVIGSSIELKPIKLIHFEPSPLLYQQQCRHHKSYNYLFHHVSTSSVPVISKKGLRKELFVKGLELDEHKYQKGIKIFQELGLVSKGKYPSWTKNKFEDDISLV